MIKYIVNENNMVERTNEDETVSFIPTDPANSDYQAYLATLVTESAPTAQESVALLIQPPFGVRFFLPRRGYGDG